MTNHNILQIIEADWIMYIFTRASFDVSNQTMVSES